MSDFRALQHLIETQPRGTPILLRADLNIPLDEAGKVRDATRLARLQPSLTALVNAGFRVAIISHFGRPKGKRDPAMSLKPIATALTDIVQMPVAFADDCIGEAAANAIAALPEGGLCVLENTRFHSGEEANDPAFARALAAGVHAFVNDAFSAAHRAHASTEGVTHFLPSYCGLAMQAELDALDAALTHPTRPLVALVGGAKISTKIAILENLSSRVDTLIIGGAMANTFIAAQGTSIGTSLYENDMLGVARHILDTAPCQLLLPHDAQIATELAQGQPASTVAIDSIPPDHMILDIGHTSTAAICAAFDKAATLVWNGPLGAFEVPPFDAATTQAARHAAALTQSGKLTSIAGGGDTLAALAHAEVAGDFSYVSTAGGAFLEWLEGKSLPGIIALKRNCA